MPPGNRHSSSPFSTENGNMYIAHYNFYIAHGTDMPEGTAVFPAVSRGRTSPLAFSNAGRHCQNKFCCLFSDHQELLFPDNQN